MKPYYHPTEDLSDLPSYASCGLMRFKLDMFRETTYRYKLFMSFQIYI